MANPYRPPDAELSQPGETVRPPLGWRIYAVAMSGLFGLSLAIIGANYGVRWMSALDVFDYGFVTPAGVVGLVGYAFSKPIGSQRFWHRWAVIQPVWDLVYALVFEPLGWSSHFPDDEPESRAEFFTRWALGFALIAPLYLALFRYGHRAQALWASREGSAEVRGRTTP